MKTCTKCKQTKELSAFGRHSGRKDNLFSWCKLCQNSAASRRRKANPQRHKAQQDRYRFANTEKLKARTRTPHYRFNMSRLQAKRRQLPWTLTEEQFSRLIAEECYYCGGAFPKAQTGSGLDRLDNTNGYHVDNVVPCCKHCNGLKLHNHTAAETLAMVAVLLEMRRPKLHAVK